MQIEARNLVGTGKWALLITTMLSLVFIVAAQQKVECSNWQTYSPKGAAFSMQVPETPSAPQGHIFDPDDNDVAHNLVGGGLRSRTYNFEVNKAGERRFLVSVLEVQLSKRVNKFITNSEVEAVTNVIGDDIEHSRVERRATEEGDVSRWSYKRKGGLEDDDETDGTVYVKRRGTHMVIVVVDYDHATDEDAEIKVMLDSLRLR